MGRKYFKSITLSLFTTALLVISSFSTASGNTDFSESTQSQQGPRDVEANELYQKNIMNGVHLVSQQLIMMGIME
ncbi:MAG TPA: hypothetical protein GXX18_01615 [Bacillales bacterium]|nr:hypothetical protein [Bacillales bacterium]